MTPSQAPSHFLHGRSEISAYLQTRYGFGGDSYVTAMARAGLELDPGYTTTPDRITRFFEANPTFTTRAVYPRPKRQHRGTVRSV